MENCFFSSETISITIHMHHRDTQCYEATWFGKEPIVAYNTHITTKLVVT